MYGETEEDQDRILHREMDALITCMYDVKDMLNPRDQSHFLVPVNIRMKHHTIKQKLLWIKTA